MCPLVLKSGWSSPADPVQLIQFGSVRQLFSWLLKSIVEVDDWSCRSCCTMVERPSSTWLDPPKTGSWESSRTAVLVHCLSPLLAYCPMDSVHLFFGLSSRLSLALLLAFFPPLIWLRFRLMFRLRSALRFDFQLDLKRLLSLRLGYSVKLQKAGKQRRFMNPPDDLLSYSEFENLCDTPQTNLSEFSQELKL